MHKTRALPRWAGAVLLFALVSIYCIEASGVEEHPGSVNGKRADIIVIDDLDALGELDEVGVTFFHDKHTDALEKLNKDCTSCHPKDEDGVMSLKFKRFEDESFAASKEIYHRECVACHAELKGQVEETGPMDGECRSCHTTKPKAESSRQPAVVSQALHFRHAVVFGNDDEPCAACHHAYDEAAKQTVPVKKPEDVQGNCGYCHAETDTVTPGGNPELVRSLNKAVHQNCISCHMERAAQEKDTGPFKCGGCHAPLSRQEIEARNQEKTEGKDIRMKRKQPDMVLIKTGLEEEAAKADPDAKALLVMGPVPFNHKLHEEKNENCSACHHRALESCSDSCHTVDGKPAEQSKETGIQLERAMHLADSELSCVGCHAAKQQAPECAACHSAMKKGLGEDKESCKSCHADVAEANATAVMAAPKGDHEVDPMARDLIKARQDRPVTFAEEDIPEKAIIDTLADQYKPAEFPHRKIVLKLVESMGDNELAKAFHTDPGTLCQGCHHNSPVSAKPPRCSNCHGKPFDPANPGRPGLKAAYHQQCMACHDAMGIDTELGAKRFGLTEPVPSAVDCTGCHKEKD